MATDQPVTPPAPPPDWSVKEKDLLNILTAISCTWVAIDMLSEGVSPEKAERLAVVRSGLSDAMMSIFKRHGFNVFEEKNE